MEFKKFSFLEKKEATEGRKERYVFIGTKEVVDRDGDIIKVDGVDTTNYEKNSVVLFAHNYHKLPIGKTINISRQDDMILFEIEFADTEDAKTVKELIDGGYLRAVSIGFIPRKIYDKDGYWGSSFEELQKDYPDWFEKKKGELAIARRVFAESELLEISVVPVPANQDAVLVMASKGYKTAFTFTKNENGEDTLIEIELPELKNAVRYSEHPDNMKVDMESSWNGAEAEKSLRKWASKDGSGDKDTIIWSRYKKGFAWYDANVIDNFTSYKFPHHKVVDNDFYVVWRGVVSAMVYLDRADIPAEDRRSVYNHLARHYKEDFDREPPEYREKGRNLYEAIKEYDDEHLSEYMKFISSEELKNLVSDFEEELKEIREEYEKLLKEHKELEEKYEELNVKYQEIVSKQSEKNQSEKVSDSPSEKEAESKESHNEVDWFSEFTQEDLTTLVKTLVKKIKEE